MELKACDITKRFKERLVLQDLSLSVREGDIYLVVGPNGSGKTTLLKILASLIRPDSGSVRLDETDVQADKARYRGRIGFLGHASMLYSHLTAKENLAFLGGLYAVRDLKTRVGIMLEEVGLQSDGDELVRNFSRGMLQRLSIARALLHNPGILLLDEPYSGLDEEAVSTLTNTLKRFSLHKRIVILTSHNLEAGLGVATRGGILYGHRICHQSEGKPGNDFLKEYLSLVRPSRGAVENA